MAKQDHYVVLADVVESRDVDNREALQVTLNEALTDLNKTYEDAIKAPFERIKGIDEFGGVLTHLAPVYDLIADVLNRIHPVRVRFGIAGGRVDINENAESVIEMDGPAFHRADRLLNEAESDDLYAYLDAGSEIDPLVSNNINLLLMHRQRLTARQVETIRAYESHGTQAKAADALDIRQQSVSMTLKRAGYEQIRRIRDYLRETLEVVYGR